MTTLTLLPPQPVDMPLMPLRDVVVFPHMVIPLFVVLCVQPFTWGIQPF